MKLSAKDIHAYERMKGGLITANGFLGTDARGLAEIIQKDSEAMEELGLTFEQAASALETLKDAGSKGLGEPTELPNGIVVQTGDARGVLPCPWDDGVFHKNSVVAENPANGGRLVYSDLSIHLLREHHFCQGRGSEFRLDPAEMAKFMPLR